MEWFLLVTLLFIAYKLEGIYKVSAETRDILERAHDPQDYTIRDAMGDGII